MEKQTKQFHEITINLNDNEIKDLMKYIDYARQEARKEARKGMIKIEDVEKMIDERIRMLDKRIKELNLIIKEEGEDLEERERKEIKEDIIRVSEADIFKQSLKELVEKPCQT